MASGVPPWQEGVVPIHEAPFALPPSAGEGRGPTGIRHIPNQDMMSYADAFTLLASTPSIVEAEARANQLCAILLRWADGKQLAIAPQKSSVTLFTFDTHQSRLHPQVRIGDAVAQLNKSPKILGVTLDTYFTFGPHTRDCVERASRALNVMKALAGSIWVFTTETLVAMY